MKPTVTLPFLSLLSLLLLSGCFTSREARIESSYSYRGRFRHYRTYNFLSGNGLTADSTRLSESLRDAVKQRMPPARLPLRAPQPRFDGQLQAL